MGVEALKAASLISQALSGKRLTRDLMSAVIAKTSTLTLLKRSMSQLKQKSYN